MPLLSINLSAATVKTLLWLAAMIFVDYAAVISAVMIDLRSGILKSRREGKARTSRGYRRSVEKLSRYLNTLLALSAVDMMIVVACMLFRATMDWSVPVFPLFTTLGAVALSLIEGKSVMENSQRATDFTEAAAKARKILTDTEILALIDTLRTLISGKTKNSSDN